MSEVNCGGHELVGLCGRLGRRPVAAAAAVSAEPATAPAAEVAMTAAAAAGSKVATEGERVAVNAAVGLLAMEGGGASGSGLTEDVAETAVGVGAAGGAVGAVATATGEAEVVAASAR
jgi:hypothetical protein